MSARNRNTSVKEQLIYASIFAALGDKTRLSLITKLRREQPCSISQLTEDSKITRQAITKHLRVLEVVGIVRRVRKGRESLFKYESKPLEKVKTYLNLVSEQWDQTLSRLKSFVEK